MPSPEQDQTPGSNERLRALLALLLLVPAPSLGVAAAMLFEPTRGTLLGQVSYGFAKLWILILPLLWLKLVERKSWSLSPLRRGGLGTGAALGGLIAVVIVGTYMLLGEQLIQADEMRRAAAANGLDDRTRYLGLAISLTLFNSLLEEYVWRWFVFRQCERLMGSTPAIFAAAAMFTAHHLLALIAQQSMSVALIASAGVFIGSCVWSWCYARFRSIWPGYVSHIIADVAVFAVGWMILFN